MTHAPRNTAMAGTPGGGSPRLHQRLAVLPFTNISPDPADAYFADGMTEELISTLSRVSGIRTIARTSAMRYRSTTRSIAEIGRELDVRTILEGSVRKSGGKIRVSVQLVETASEEHLWTATYDRDLADVFGLQRDIAQRVAKALRVRLQAVDTAQLERPVTAVADAYTLYLQGRAEWNLRTEASLRSAVRDYEAALQRDPRFALALAGLADAHAALAVLELDPPTESFPRARTAAETAISLDPLSAEAHAAVGLVRFQYERDWEGAERELRRAVELNPNYPAGHQYLADLLKALGRFDEATAEMRTALELDPLSMAISTGLGHVLYLSRRYDDAIAQYRTALGLDPNFVLAHLWFGRPFLQQGRFDEAIAEIQQAVELSGGSTISLAVLGHALASAGRTEEAFRILADLKARAAQRYLPSYWVALIYTGLGDTGEALRWLERAYEERSSWLVWIGVEPRFDSLRGEAGFRSLLSRMRLPASGPSPSPDGGSPIAEAAELLGGLEELRFDRYRVVGSYTRFHEGVRHRLKDLRQRVAGRFEGGAADRDNLLIWGAPGTGKTFLVQEIAASLPSGTRLQVLNLAETDEPGFRAALASLGQITAPTLCFVDEVDSKPAEPWPYEAMLPWLDLGRRAPAPLVFVLAGSSGADLDAMRTGIARRPKGADLLSRIPEENSFAIPPLSAGDRLLVAPGSLRQAGARAGRRLTEVEKLALLYLMVQPDLANPRQLRDRSVRAVERLPVTEERLRFDQLFHAGDPGNKEFWVQAKGAAPELLGSFVRLGE